MSNKTISTEDKQIVITRLAQGMSTRQAIEGTSVKSNNTAAHMAKREAHRIAQYRSRYLYAIENASQATMTDRAMMWGEMTRACKNEVVTYITKTNQLNGAITKVPVIDQVPDWSIRERALRYIDGLAQQTLPMPTRPKIQNNFFNQPEHFTVTT